MKCLHIPLLIIFAACAQTAQAKMYKWVDENGQTHFGDKIPTQYLSREHKELNEQGATVKEHSAMETEEERMEKLRLERIEKEKQKKIEEQARRDREILDTYTTERDLVAARNARLEAVGSQLQLSESIIKDAQRKLELTEKQMTQIKASGKEVPANIMEKMEREQDQLDTYKKVAAGHMEKRDKINQQFDAYLTRFRELKAGQQRIKEERETRRRQELGLEP